MPILQAAVKVIRVLLLPFSILYDLVTRARNHLYDIGHKRSFQFETLVISIGNLNVGGSGKTPMVEYVVRLLGQRKMAILSRGYGRKTRGFKMADEMDTALTVGDEPYQMFRKFFPDLVVTVCEDRAFAIPNILHMHPDTELILMDDAYQHRTVKPQLSILLTEYKRPFTRDFILPTGNLREARAGAKRADVVVVTKCPDEVKDESQLVLEIRKYAPTLPVFFSRITYADPMSFGSQQNLTGDMVVIVSGIASADYFENHIKEKFKMVKHFQYADHHRFTLEEINQVIAFAKKGNYPIVTTEKDMVRLIGGEAAELISNHPWFYVPIRMKFIKDGSEFDELVLGSLKRIHF